MSLVVSPAFPTTLPALSPITAYGSRHILLKDWTEVCRKSLNGKPHSCLNTYRSHDLQRQCLARWGGDLCLVKNPSLQKDCLYLTDTLNKAVYYCGERRVGEKVHFGDGSKYDLHNLFSISYAPRKLKVVREDKSIYRQAVSPVQRRDDDETVCPVCYDDLSGLRHVVCSRGHATCYKCQMSMTEVGNHRCPKCRDEFINPVTLQVRTRRNMVTYADVEELCWSLTCVYKDKHCPDRTRVIAEALWYFFQYVDRSEWGLFDANRCLTNQDVSVDDTDGTWRKNFLHWFLKDGKYRYMNNNLVDLDVRVSHIDLNECLSATREPTEVNAILSACLSDTNMSQSWKKKMTIERIVRRWGSYEIEILNADLTSVISLISTIFFSTDYEKYVEYTENKDVTFLDV